MQSCGSYKSATVLIQELEGFAKPHPEVSGERKRGVGENFLPGLSEHLSGDNPSFQSRSLCKFPPENFIAASSQEPDDRRLMSKKKLTAQAISVENGSAVENKVACIKDNKDAFFPISNQSSCDFDQRVHPKCKVHPISKNNFNSSPKPYVRVGNSKDQNNSGVMAKPKVEEQEQWGRKKESRRIVGDYVNSMKREVEKTPQKAAVDNIAESSVCLSGSQLPDPMDESALPGKGVVKGYVEKFDSMDESASPGKGVVKKYVKKFQRTTSSVIPAPQSSVLLDKENVVNKRYK